LRGRGFSRLWLRAVAAAAALILLVLTLANDDWFEPQDFHLLPRDVRRS